MEFNFEKFVDTDKSFAARATIRQRTGQIGFNLGSINLYKIRDYTKAVLYFDREQRVIGIEFTNEGGPGAIDIKQSRTNTYVRAKNFLDKYGIDYENSHTHELNRDGETGMLYFSLGETVKEEDDTEGSDDSNSENADSLF